MSKKKKNQIIENKHPSDEEIECVREEVAQIEEMLFMWFAEKKISMSLGVFAMAQIIAAQCEGDPRRFQSIVNFIGEQVGDPSKSDLH